MKKQIIKAILIGFLGGLSIFLGETISQKYFNNNMLISIILMLLFNLIFSIIYGIIKYKVDKK